MAKVLGTLARLIGQPPVIGEIVAGLAIGPTLFHGQIAATLFPTEIRPLLASLANVGLALFMFIVGCELEHAIVAERKGVPISVSLGSTVLPFALGSALALYLFSSHGGHNNKLGFVLFFGASMSVTAFPVLARILSDRGMNRTEVGAVALASAALSDVLAWSLLAVAVTVSGGSGQWRTLLMPAFVAVLCLVVRPLLARMSAEHLRRGKAPSELLAPIVVGLFLSSWATEWMGVHFIFGAFLFGAIMPRDGIDGMRRQITSRLEPVTTVVLLPIFFIVAGFKVNLSELDVTAWGQLGLIMVVAVSAKMAGAFCGARLQGVPNREAGVLAALMNTRGLTELVILSVGLQLGFLDDQLYSLMVVMAIVTTMMTGPLLSVLYPRDRVEQDAAELAATTSPS
ncbi:MAG: cation:proton antiporter [Jatrophihabitantaceae bacterium]